MKVRVLFFAAARQWAGSSGIELDLPAGARVREAVTHERLSFLGAHLRSLRFAVNEEFAGMERPLREGDALAVLPPVSGG